jgi:tetratricopeptide (TPR) repeat protein
VAIDASDELDRRIREDRPQPASRLGELGLALANVESKLFGRPRPTMTVQRYVLLHRVASGGIGTVFAAYDPELDRRVAVKLLRGARGGTEGAALLAEEARALAKLAHPNVITVHDAGMYDPATLDPLMEEPAGSPASRHPGVFVVMELVSGPTLARWIVERTPSVRAIVEVFVAAAAGLAAAHGAGLVHHDFKPDNVIVADDGRVRVIDFGLARAVGRTETGVVAGTPLYMAPEQHRGEATDARADQYAFCVALAEAVLGRSPFAAQSVQRLAAAKQEGVPPVDALPRWLRRIVARGLAPSAADRHPDMQAIAAALRSGLAAPRRIVMVAGGAALVGVVALVARAGTAECEDPQQHLVGTWDEARRTELRAAFAATEVPWAADSLRGVEASFDAFASAWIAEHRDACEQTLVARTASSADMTAKMVCLERQLVRLDGLASTLAAGGAAVIERAVDGLYAAWNQAERASEHELAVRALVGLVLVEGHDLRRLDVADRHATLALSKVSARDVGPAIESDLQRNLGVLRIDQGRHDEATTALQRAVSIIEASFGAEHPRLTVVLVALGGLEAARGDFPGALAIQRRALDLLTAQLGEHHPRIAIAKINLGASLRMVGEYADAEALSREALEIFVGAYGPEHPHVVSALNNYAAVLIGMGREEEALGHLQRARALRVKHFGADAAAVATIESNLGALLHEMGREEDALAHNRRAVELRTKHLGAEHPDTAGARVNLAASLIALRRFDEARREADACARTYEATYGPQSPLLVEPLRIQGELALATGDLAAAAEHLERAVAIADTQHADPLVEGDARFGLARAIVATDPARALELARAADAQWTSFPPTHHRRVRLHAWLADHGDESSR